MYNSLSITISTNCIFNSNVVYWSIGTDAVVGRSADRIHSLAELDHPAASRGIDNYLNEWMKRQHGRLCCYSPVYYYISDGTRLLQYLEHPPMLQRAPRGTHWLGGPDFSRGEPWATSSKRNTKKEELSPMPKRMKAPARSASFNGRWRAVCLLLIWHQYVSLVLVKLLASKFTKPLSQVNIILPIRTNCSLIPLPFIHIGLDSSSSRFCILFQVRTNSSPLDWRKHCWNLISLDEILNKSESSHTNLFLVLDV